MLCCELKQDKSAFNTPWTKQTLFHTSVCHTYSALSNLSLNIQGHVEVTKSKNKLKKIMSVSCNEPLHVKI